MHLGDYTEAAIQTHIALPIAREWDAHRTFPFALLILGMIALVQQDDRTAQQWMQESIAAYEHARMRDEIGLAYAVAGGIEQRLGRRTEAVRHLANALRTGIEHHSSGPLNQALPFVALLCADEGQIERAVELYALTLCHPYVANSRWWKDVVGKHINAAAATLPPQVVAAAEARGRARDLWATARELLDELEQTFQVSET